MAMLSRIMRRLSYQPFLIEHKVDPKKRYQRDLDPAFPFAVDVFSYDHIDPPYPLNWHERLELFIPTAGHGSFAMGDWVTEFNTGDVLVIDNLKLHGFLSFRGAARRAMVVTFLPEFIYTLGSPRCDSMFLMPFYGQHGPVPPVIRAGDRVAPTLQDALSRLLECYFAPEHGPYYTAGCKAYLLETLYVVLAHFGKSESVADEFQRHQEQSRAFGALHNFLLDHFSERVTVTSAAAIVHMSESNFMKYFKRATGETFVSYLTRLRMERARQLLEETSVSIGEVAYAVGFADQSYFDRMFRRHFRRTPRQVRSERGAKVTPLSQPEWSAR